jgi:UDP-3-O-[3-hydroxymyristoyl] N-acetylglucosamine deacetylase
MLRRWLRYESTTQRTLRATISYVGIGLHTGRKVSMLVRPADPDTGVRFLRKDAHISDRIIDASWENVVDTRLSTVLGNGYGLTVGTVEHLMAALRGCGVDNAIIELDGPEVPIMDGSSEPFVSLIERVGTISQGAERRAIWMRRPVEARDGDKFVILMPDVTSRVTVVIDFAKSAVGVQKLTLELVNDTFQRDLARARTFGFAHELEHLRRQGLARGGSLRNAILVDGDRIVNEEGLRFRDEFIRHKVLDTVGDLALAGVPIIGHYFGFKPGHKLNNALMRQLFADKEAWSFLPIQEISATLSRTTRSRAKAVEQRRRKAYPFDAA